MKIIAKSRQFLPLLVIILSHISYADSSYLTEDPYSQSVFGGVGLIVTPTARFSEDGEFGFGVSSESPFNRMYGKSQILPWLEAVLRYTEETHRSYGNTMYQTNKDKGIDFKIRLLSESDLLPQIAVGFTDFGGTGRYSSEFFVASKRFNDIDFTLGLGWGRLGAVDHFNNPLGWFNDEKKVRGSSSYLGGTFNLGRFFTGPTTSVFGGLEYFTPINNLSLKLEYDTSNYTAEIGKSKRFDGTDEIFELNSRVNYALNYRLDLGTRDKLDLSIGYIRGNTMYANFAIHSNLNYKGPERIRIGGEKIRNSNLPAQSYKELDQKWKKFLTDRIIKEMASNGFVTHKVIFNGNELAAEISQGRFLESSKFFDLASRILANNALQNIDTLTVINIDQGIETIRTSVNRNDLKRAVIDGPLPEELLVFDEQRTLDSDSITVQNEYLYPNFFWEIKPHMLGTLQHQQRFYFWQLEALIHTEYSIKQGLYFTTDIGINISNNYDEYTYHIPDGELYHVRQDRRLYLTEGESGLRRMALDYLVKLSPNINAKFSAGIIEWMYGGFGGEALYMPTSRNWALGLEAYWVKQRDFDQRFSFKDYETVTGFLTYYRDIPFYDMRLKLSMGKFLGKDVGAHIDISRRFDTGARVGGIVALTDCDSACVGEGSFNKWIYFELPMDLFFVNRNTRGKTGYAWSPLTKDAGQKIEQGGLYNLMVNSPDEVKSIKQKNWSMKKIFNGFGTDPKERI